MSADCEIEIKPDVQCGVTAFGRCERCDKAFCKSHASTFTNGEWRNTFLDYSPNLCESCRQSGLRKSLERDRAEGLKRRSRHEYLDALLSALNSSGKPVLRVVKLLDETHVKGSFGRFKLGPVYRELPEAYPVGKMHWEWTVQLHYGDEKKGESDHEMGVTPKGKLVFLDWYIKGSTERSKFEARNFERFPWEGNAKAIPDEQREQVIKSLERIAREHGIPIP